MAPPPDDFAGIALPLMDHVYSVARYLARNESDADDLVQETYLRACRFWHQFEGGTNCKAWLLTILYNVHRHRYRQRLRERLDVEFDDRLLEPESTTGSSAVGINPEEAVLSTLLDEEVEAALRRLPPDFLDVVVLIDVQELTYEEAAAAIGCPIGTVRSRLARGRRLLHRHLQAYATARGLLRRLS
jgi:RNA polymerase sigma-70 factor (ECF subfamily)